MWSKQECRKGCEREGRIDMRDRKGRRNGGGRGKVGGGRGGDYCVKTNG